MSQSEMSFTPGNLVKARGREWVVQNDSTENSLKLRPLGGADADIVTLIPSLEFEPVMPATFAWPNPEYPGNHSAALLLRDALRLSLRSGAGPFRSFGNIAVDPRAYQLVPLLMALRLNTVRLLIADDVGVGKTIEAGLIVRELMDRNEITKLAVLCPPHLVEQWQTELETRFNLPSVALTSATAARVERELPYGVKLTDHFPIIVVSLDYIKSERHREHFLSIAPECIIVDEAHTCSTSGQGKQLRYELLQRLAADSERHILLLTATPHSGNESAFYNLLAILDPKFAQLEGVTQASHPLRQELARHFVQRRRQDIEEWDTQSAESSGFPRRFKAEITYKLTGEWGAFFDAVQNYCVELAENIEQQGEQQARLVWYATLALLRCVSSSPASAVKALSNRIESIEEEGSLLADERLYDGDADDLTINDIEPAAQLENSKLAQLITTAQKLSGKKGDPKLAKLVEHIKEHLDDGFHPVIFCRYIATAHYVTEHLKKAFPKVDIQTVTGENTPEERRLIVEDMQDSPQRILVATDCLSEGINLQHVFTSVVHYDLAWNPTRHEQREGRVDRFGQQASEVRCTMIYGEDNPVDGFILNVILRKAEAIQKELGVLVPMPEDDKRINQALVKAALMKRSSAPQQTLDLFAGMEDDLQPVQTQWEDALDKAKKNRTVFAQRSLKPEEVLPEWKKQQEALGTQADVQRFITTAAARLNAPLEAAKNGKFQLLPKYLPEALRLRFEDEGIVANKPFIIDFNEFHRSHPVVNLLADHLLEDSLQESESIAARCAVTETDAVEEVTTLYLLRLRHNLEYVRRRVPYQMMAEETVTLAVAGRVNPSWLTGSEVSRLLECQPSSNLPKELIVREVTQALELLQNQRHKLEQLAEERAQVLLSDHQRVREAARDIGQYSVTACLPVDVIGVYVLLPESL